MRLRPWGGNVGMQAMRVLQKDRWKEHPSVAWCLGHCSNTGQTGPCLVPMSQGLQRPQCP